MGDTVSVTETQITDQEAADCIEALWRDAFDLCPYGVVCTLLRVSGLQDAGWDPFEESEAAFEDFNWHLNAQDDALSPTSQWRIGLLMYCQAIEMSAVHATLANILRILLGEPYHLNPLGSLGRPNKKRMFKFYPPSAKVKWQKLGNMATEARRDELVRMIDAVYNDSVRNAFSHSDYILTETHFRWTEGGLGSQMPLEHVNNLITNAFSFFGSFMSMRDRWLRLVGEMPRYHKWPRYEVLELLKDEDRKLNGFRVHFSNGNSAHFARTPEGVDCCNLDFQGDGTIGFMVGNLDALEPIWKVDGRTVDFGEQTAVEEF